uniref:Photosystem II reaction center protein Z n=1 Tax=Cyanidium sp. THAL103 TaxID=3027999 RepID=A0A9Y1I3X3_9RHOD|nr:Ycf9 [Cyanidium sp. THAL103]
MSILLQILIISLVIISFILLAGIPLIMSSNGNWQKSRQIVYNLSAIWIGIVLMSGFVSNFT